MAEPTAKDKYRARAHQTTRPDRPAAAAPAMASAAGAALMDQVAGGAVLQQTQTEFVTAVRVQVARDVGLIRKRAEDEARAFPEKLVYQWSANNRDGSKSVIQGPSIAAANMLARLWGNCAVSADVIAETPSHWTLKGKFIDIETGYTITRSFLQRKPKDGVGKMDADRTQDIAFQIGQSKVMRNVVVNAMPKGLVEAVMRASLEGSAQQVTREGQSGMTRLYQSFERIGVTKDDLVRKVGRPVAEWTAADIASLKATFDSIEERQTTVAQEFGGGRSAADVFQDDDIPRGEG